MIEIDTKRFRPDAYIVNATAQVQIGGQNVLLSVLGFGYNKAGTEDAMLKMERVLGELGYTSDDWVRVY